MSVGKLTQEVTDEICTGIENGLSYKDSCILAGISQSTYNKWLREGKKAKSGKKRAFYEEVKKSKVKAKAHHILKINEDKSWTSSAWMLERRYPEEYGRKEVIFVKSDKFKDQKELVQNTLEENKKMFNQKANNISNQQSEYNQTLDEIIKKDVEDDKAIENDNKKQNSVLNDEKERKES